MSVQQKLRVLVIDDEITQRMLVKEYLEEAGHLVRLSEDGKRGFKMATATNPDIILLDLMLPSIDGYSLCKSLKSNPGTAEIPVILITASREADVIEKGLAAGADDFVTKPVDWAFLSDRVQNVVAKSKERADMARQLREQSQAQPQVNLQPAESVGINSNLGELMRCAELQIEQAHEAGRTERARLEAEHAEAINHAIDQAREELTAEFTAEFDAEIASREAIHAQAIGSALAQARATFEAEISRQAEIHSQALSNAIEQAQSEFVAEIENLERQHSQSLRSLKEQSDLEIATALASAQNDRLAAERRHEAEIAALKSALDASVDLQGEHATAIREATAAEYTGKLHAAWNLALRSTAAQSNLAAAIASKASAAAAPGAMSVDSNEIERAARSLSNLFASFKLLAQSMTSPVPSKATPVDVSAMATDIATQAGRIARERRVEVRSSSIEPGIIVMADEGRLRYAWMSLVINAIRFTPAGGFVDTTVESREDGAVCIAVSDSGVGIAPLKLRELRTCLDAANSENGVRPGESAGLGIPVATALIRQLGGSIEIDSQLGNGTRAALVLPSRNQIHAQHSQPGVAGLSA